MNTIETVILIAISVLLISLVLMQSSKAEGASTALTGGLDLFSDRKERGVEKFITRVTFALGFIFFIITFLLAYVI